VRCTVLHPAASPHATQVTTGLALLAARGELVLKYSSAPQPDWDCPPPRLSRNRSLLLVDVDGRNVAFDLDDSATISEGALGWSAVYFKRMLDPGDAARGIEALGLNHPVGVSVTSGPGSQWDDVPSVQLLTPSAEPGRGVLFLTRLWDPGEAHSEPDRAWRHHINGVRVAILDALREATGDDLSGGIVPDPFSHRTCPPHLLADPTSTRKSAYLARASAAAVVVTSQGLHGSVGWRFAESLALGRPTAGEPMACVVPGPLAPGSHYLEFTDPADAAQEIARLLADATERDALRAAASSYHREWLAPDALVARAIHRVLSQP